MGTNTTHILDNEYYRYIEIPIEQSTVRLYVVNYEDIISQRLQDKTTKQIGFVLKTQLNDFPILHSTDNSCSTCQGKLNNGLAIQQEKIELNFEKDNEFFAVKPQKISINFTISYFITKRKENSKHYSSLFDQANLEQDSPEQLSQEAIQSILTILNFKSHQIRSRLNLLFGQLLKRKVTNFVIAKPQTTTKRLSDKLESIYLCKCLQVILAIVYEQFAKLKNQQKSHLPSINFYFVGWEKLNSVEQLEKQWSSIKNYAFDQ